MRPLTSNVKQAWAQTKWLMKITSSLFTVSYLAQSTLRTSKMQICSLILSNKERASGPFWLLPVNDHPSVSSETSKTHTYWLTYPISRMFVHLRHRLCILQDLPCLKRHSTIWSNLIRFIDVCICFRTLNDVCFFTGMGIAALFVSLVVRLITTYLGLLRNDLNLKERLFIAVAWLPKATVQVRQTTTVPWMESVAFFQESTFVPLRQPPCSTMSFVHDTY